MDSVLSAVTKITDVDLFVRDGEGKIKTGRFVGNPFYIDYGTARVLVADKWKLDAGGLPQGSLLLAYYEGETDVQEALLLRVLGPAPLPSDSDVTRSMIEYYKDDLRTSGPGTQLDTFTRYEFSFSGLECRVLGSFYREAGGRVEYGADLENFFSAHHYSVIKPDPSVLEAVVNFREGRSTGGLNDIKIGRVRYSSSRRFQSTAEDVPVYVRADDFLGKRTALFGMTRTGKSNTVKKVIEATVALSRLAPGDLAVPPSDPTETLEPFTRDHLPKYPVGQIVFDVNGEYANPNLQDQGTAIFQMFEDDTVRYSVIEKPGFRVMKVNFYEDVESGFELVRSHLADASGNYIDSFRAVDVTRPEDYDTNFSARTRHDRKVAAYLCCLARAGFKIPSGRKVTFKGNKDLNAFAKEDGSIDPSKGITLEEATSWFTGIWDNYNNDYFTSYKRDKGHEWADEDLKAILVFLTRKRQPGKEVNVDGYIRLRSISNLHTSQSEKPFEIEITELLRRGRIVIVDLSQGDPSIQQLYSERITQKIFRDSMDRFIANVPNNFVQFYFEEAHNLFPKRDDKDLAQIYNRVAKEGAKLQLGLLYATQEVSSISSNILKNTQNWFIAHLNNEDETREIRKYYDFGDFTGALVRFSASNDKGFVRMKTYSNPFVVPVQIDRFPSEAES